MQHIIKYLRACYQTDNRALSLYNFFSSKAEQSLILSDSELLNSALPFYPISENWLDKSLPILSTYSKEKELYTCALFVTADILIVNKKQKIAAPLLLYPSEINYEERGVSLTGKQVIINSPLLQLLKTTEVDLADVLQKLSDVCQGSQLEVEQVHQIRSILSEYFPELDTKELLLYPKTLNKKEFKQKQEEADNPKIWPSVGVCILKKSSSTLGVLNELEELASSNEYSEPLIEFLEGCKPYPENDNKVDSLVPVILSKAQEQIFKAVDRFTSTLIQGPPGTGKSFTISALASNYALHDKSVLVVASNHQALDVIESKISNDFELENVIVRGGADRDSKKSLKSHLRDLLRGVGIDEVEKHELDSVYIQLEDLSKKLDQTETLFKKNSLREEQRGELDATEEKNLLDKLKLIYLNFLLRNKHLWTQASRLEKLSEEKNDTIRKFIRMKSMMWQYATLKNQRKIIKNFHSGIIARTFTRKEEFFDQINFSKLQKPFPIWISSINEVSTMLPLSKDLFDLVIIDEASQTDIASILPVLQRAKKVVICGDSNQLQHISFLSGSKQSYLANNYELKDHEVSTFDFRNLSSLELLNNQLTSQDQTIFLNEHYRSQPSIIEFSNQNFYSNGLAIMTNSPLNEGQQSVQIHPLDGKRVKSGYNKVEVDFIFEKIEKIIENEADLPFEICQSIGVLSPFREQINYIQKRILKEFQSKDIQRHKIVVGTPHSFQGEEKDIMFLSFCLDQKTHPSAFIHLNKEDVFNVSITRARAEQHIVHSLDLNSLNEKHLMTKYLRSISEVNTHSIENNETDQFWEETKEMLTNLGIKTIHSSYIIAGIELDLVFVHKEKCICIDLIGYPGAFSESFPSSYYKILKRAGIDVFPLPYYTWKNNKQVIENQIKDLLK
ncbi:DEAD/DEAH box helicase [Sediminitomix flava]|uniref:AAA domain-containing protein n=1 Tax=Sediminitomix flava TaxID=379075 RepID=A0A315Z579_SEDFL|nr:ATP-binding protein [Sediminitomix flava]PWJ38618.1 AAA domain-containing protein [Sediminitomix flava]